MFLELVQKLLILLTAFFHDKFHLAVLAYPFTGPSDMKDPYSYIMCHAHSDSIRQ